MLIKKNNRVVFRNIEVAKSLSDRMKGLSGRKEMGCGGLLFDFPREARHGIWMPNMGFPIDIVFISKAKKVVDIKHRALPLTLHPKTWKVYKPKEKAKYVLEIPANCAKGKIKTGDSLSF